MSSQLKTLQRSAPAATSDAARAASGFKPLALPALAAAVRGVRQEGRTRQPAVHELPAILRKEAFPG